MVIKKIGNMRISENGIINDVLIQSAKELEDRITEFYNRVIEGETEMEEITLTDGWIIKLEHLKYKDDVYSNSVILYRSEWQWQKYAWINEDVRVSISYADRIRNIPIIASGIIYAIRNTPSKDAHDAYIAFNKVANRERVYASHNKDVNIDAFFS